MNKQWNVLNIKGNQINRDIAIVFLNKYHCGIHETKDKSFIYFE